MRKSILMLAGIAILTLTSTGCSLLMYEGDYGYQEEVVLVPVPVPGDCFPRPVPCPAPYPETIYVEDSTPLPPARHKPLVKPRRDDDTGSRTKNPPRRLPRGKPVTTRRTGS